MKPQFLKPVGSAEMKALVHMVGGREAGKQIWGLCHHDIMMVQTDGLPGGPLGDNYGNEIAAHTARPASFPELTPHTGTACAQTHSAELIFIAKA